MKRILSRGALLCGLLLAAACGGAEEPAAEAPVVEAPAPPAPDPNAFLDPNTAPADQLATAPGLDSTKVAALVAGRPYATMTAVDAAVGAGLTEEQKDALYARVWLPLDLNSATEEEILLIPGMTDRMAHEFEEYRPYDAIERFRLEIGKYVDATEVARLEKYVTIK